MKDHIKHSIQEKLFNQDMTRNISQPTSTIRMETNNWITKCLTFKNLTAMKTMIKSLVCIISTVIISSNLFAQTAKKDYRQYKKELNRERKAPGIFTYNSEFEPDKPPIYMINKKYISLKDYGIKRKNASVELIVTATGKYKSKGSDDSGIEGARKIAWANARKKFFDNHIDEFIVNSKTVGSNADARISEKESFYEFLTKDIKGVSPITELKTEFHYDIATKTYICYGLYYIRKNELEKRLKELRRKDEDRLARENYELLADKYLKERNEYKSKYENIKRSFENNEENSSSEQIYKTPGNIKTNATESMSYELYRSAPDNYKSKPTKRTQTGTYVYKPVYVVKSVSYGNSGRVYPRPYPSTKSYTSYSYGTTQRCSGYSGRSHSHYRPYTSTSRYSGSYSNRYYGHRNSSHRRK